MKPNASPVTTITSALAFALVTSSAYACWAFASVGLGSPMALYIACTMVFLLLGPFSLHRLVRDRARRLRFFLLYNAAFLCYAIAWVLLWSLLHNKTGEWLGSLLGLSAMVFLFHKGLGRPAHPWRAIVILFLLHSAGYHLGEWIHQTWSHSHTTLARLGWGLAHGLGFGAGLALILRPEAAPPGEEPAAS